MREWGEFRRGVTLGALEHVWRVNSWEIYLALPRHITLTFIIDHIMNLINEIYYEYDEWKTSYHCAP